MKTRGTPHTTGVAALKFRCWWRSRDHRSRREWHGDLKLDLLRLDHATRHDTIHCESTPPPAVSDIFSKRLRILVNFLHNYYTFLCTLDTNFYSIISNFDQVMPY